MAHARDQVSLYADWMTLRAKSQRGSPGERACAATNAEWLSYWTLSAGDLDARSVAFILACARQEFLTLGLRGRTARHPIEPRLDRDREQ